MFKSYFKTAYRFLLKNRAFSLINIIGLSIGTLCCIYIVLYVVDQYSYDKHHVDGANLYRINSTISLPGAAKTLNSATSSPIIAPTLQKDFKEVVSYTRLVMASGFGTKQSLLRYQDKTIYEKDFFYVDSTFFNFFTYHFVNGSPAHALDQGYSAVLMRETAQKLFGNQDPVGKMIEIENTSGKHPFKITGVVDESLGKSHIHGRIFVSMNSGDMGEYTLHNNAWAGDNYCMEYIKLRGDADTAAFDRKLAPFLEKHGAQDLKSLGMKKAIYLQPVTSIHTMPGHEHEPVSDTVSSSFLNILLLIAGLIQLMACINFMNLSTARATKRAREVGVRKVIGAEKGQLMQQFLAESVLLAFLGVLGALLLLRMTLPLLNQITGADISLVLLADYRLWLMVAVFILVTGLLAGSYPALYLSAFQPIKVIKGNFSNQVSATGIRKSLVVIQFVLSIGLMTGVVVIYSQLNYMKHMDLGFEKDQKLIFNVYTQEAIGRLDGLSNDIRQLSEVKAVSRANNYPSQFIMNDWIYFLEGGNVSTGQDVEIVYVDENYVKAVGIKIDEGRDFRQNDSGRVIINELLARRLGIKSGSVSGTRLYPFLEPGDTPFSLEIVGVMKDFNYNSLHGEIKPMMIRYNKGRTDRSKLIVSVSASDYPQFFGKLEAIWHRDMPGIPFEYAFLDQEVDKQYGAEITLSKIINTFTMMAILISSLGLFGLAAFSAEQRIKEIGIRKILGANLTDIVTLLSKDFVKLVAIAIVISIPIGWWAMHKWLNAFAYRIPITWWMFCLSAGAAVVIALATVSSQAIRAGVANPVKSLRSE